MSKIPDRTVRNMQADAVFHPFWGAVADAGTAENGRSRLHLDKSAWGNGSLCLHEHAERADVQSLGLEDTVGLTVVPTKMYLAVDGNALVQPFVDSCGRRSRCRPSWNRLLYAHGPLLARQNSCWQYRPNAEHRHRYGDAHVSCPSTYLWIPGRVTRT